MHYFVLYTLLEREMMYDLFLMDEKKRKFFELNTYILDNVLSLKA